MERSMSTTEIDEIGEVLNKVRTWSTEQRLALTQEILQTLSRDLGVPSSSHKTLKDLLGLLKSENRPPSDAECEKIVEEERFRKYTA
jgi:hypothetical protein